MSFQVPFGLNNVKFKFWKKRSLSITEYDPVYKVVYLGNVLTPWAKGDGCVEKPLATLWKNYCSNVKHEIYMKLTICNSGLKAITREHGLTEYWASRVTYCSGGHPSYPKVFCWIYRHEGRKMKQELRCHAVLCNKESKAIQMSEILNQRLTTALQEFRREKKIRQNARLSLANSCQEISVIPVRKQLLIKGLANFKPPLERSKSAPKLTSIEEMIEESETIEEDEDEDDDYEYPNCSESLSEGRETASDFALEDGDSLSDHFTTTINLQCNSRYCDTDLVAEVPNPFTNNVGVKLKLIAETVPEEDNLNGSDDESGYSETGDTASSSTTTSVRSTNEMSRI